MSLSHKTNLFTHVLIETYKHGKHQRQLVDWTKWQFSPLSSFISVMSRRQSTYSCISLVLQILGKALKYFGQEHSHEKHRGFSAAPTPNIHVTSHTLYHLTKAGQILELSRIKGIIFVYNQRKNGRKNGWLVGRLYWGLTALEQLGSYHGRR